MRCLACWKNLDASNRQIADKDVVVAGVTIAKTTGRPLPYCKDCIYKYKAREVLSKLPSAQRSAYVKETAQKLKESKTNHTAEDVEDAEIRLKGIGFTNEEIETILKEIK